MAWTVSLPIPQKSTATEREKPLVLTDAIPLEDAKGRFDHFGSNVVEVINIGRRILDHTIRRARSTGRGIFPGGEQALGGWRQGYRPFFISAIIA
jgi:hypothetical protein